MSSSTTQNQGLQRKTTTTLSTLEYHGSSYFRQRLILSTLSGRTIIIKNIRSESSGLNASSQVGIQDYEANFLRLLDKITDGGKIVISKSGTQLRYEPGLLVGCSDKLIHKCSQSRCITYWLEGLVLLLPFSRNLTKLKLIGITNNNIDISIDTFRAVTLPLMMKFFSAKNDSRNHNNSVKGGGCVGGGINVNAQQQLAKSLTSDEPNTLETLKKDNPYLDCNTTNFENSMLGIKVIKRCCNTSTNSSDSNGVIDPSNLGEVDVSIPIVKRVRPVNLLFGKTINTSGTLNSFQCQRIRGVAFTHKISPQFATRITEGVKSILGDYQGDLWIWNDHDKAQNIKKDNSETVTDSSGRGFGVSLVAESKIGSYFKAVDCFSNGIELNETDKECWSKIMGMKRRYDSESKKSKSKGMKKRKKDSSKSSDEEESDDDDDDESDKSDSDDSKSTNASDNSDGEKSDSKPEESDDKDVKSEEEEDLPHQLGQLAAHKLLSEISLSGVIDTSHQVMAIHYLALAEEDAQSRILLGSKISPAGAEYLKLIRDFFGLEFSLREVSNGDSFNSLNQNQNQVVLSCVGVGVTNLSRRTF